MKTAREQLFDEATGLLAKAADNGSAGVMKKIMGRYRVQTKPGVEIPAGATARDALGDRLLELWRAGGDDDARGTRHLGNDSGDIGGGTRVVGHAVVVAYAAGMLKGLSRA